MCITAGLHRALQRKPDATAYLFDGKPVSWRVLSDRVSRVASALRGLGMLPGDRLAVLSENIPAFYEAYLAAPWADLILAGMNYRWSRPELMRALDDAGADVMLVDRRHADWAAELAATRPFRQLIFADEGPVPAGFVSWEDLIEQARPMPDARRGGDQVLYLFYTSGTTGQAKGVMLTGSNVLCGALMTIGEFGWYDDHISLCCTPLFHVGGSAPCLAQITMGSTVALLRRFEAEAVLGAIERDRPTQVQLVPTMMQMLADHPKLHEFTLTSVKRITYGAAPMPPALIDRMLTVFPNTEFQQGYALTESGALGTSLPPADHLAGNRDVKKLRSVGRAVPGVELAILDFNGVKLPNGQTGEVTIRSPTVMAGYWQRSLESAEALRGGCLHTGDSGYLDEDGYLHVVGRIKDMIISGGENIYAAEVEAAVYSHQGVAECAAIGLPDPRWGELVAIVVYLRDGWSVTDKQLIECARQHVGGYKVPRRVFFSSQPLPKSSSGKIVKRSLAEQYKNV